MPTRRARSTTASGAVLAAALAVAACGSDDGSATGTGTEPTTQPSATAIATAAPSTAASTTTPTSIEVVELGEADWDGLDPIELPAMGGLRLGVEPEWSVYHDNYMATIRPRFEQDRGRTLPTVVAALVYNERPTEVGATVEDIVDIGFLGTATPNGRMLELFGSTWQGYSFRLADGLPPAPHYLYPTVGPAMVTATAWQPLPLGELFLTDVPGGVAAVGYIGTDESELAEARQVFERVAPTFELVSGLPDEVPQSLEPFRPADFPMPVSPINPAAEMAAPLRAAFSPLDAGRHQFIHLATPFEIEVGDGWWVQFNEPAVIVLSGNDSFGPADRSIDFRLGITELFPVDTGPIPVGTSTDISDIDAFVTAPPTGIELTDVTTVELGGATATRFDLRIADDAACTVEEPCHYVAPSAVPGPNPIEFQKYFRYRIWRVDDLAEPITIVAANPEASWLDDAAAIVESAVVAATP